MSSGPGETTSICSIAGAQQVCSSTFPAGHSQNQIKWYDLNHQSGCVIQALQPGCPIDELLDLMKDQHEIFSPENVVVISLI
jgi:hypothetical protein